MDEPVNDEPTAFIKSTINKKKKEELSVIVESVEINQLELLKQKSIKVLKEKLPNVKKAQ